MKHPKNIHPRFTEFELKTSIFPLFLATRLLDQLKNYLWAELPDDLADEVAQKAENAFARNPRSRKMFQGPSGLSYVEMLMRCWLAEALFERKSPLFWELPDEFRNGEDLPAISPMLQSELDAGKTGNEPLRKNRRRQMYPSAAKSRPVRLLAHGSELLAV